MPNRYYSPVNPEYEGGKMPKNGGKGNDDGREMGKVEKMPVAFEHKPGDPNEGAKKLPKQSGAEE